MLDAASGQRIARIPLGSTIRERYDAPYLVCARSALRDTLLSALRARGDVDLRFGDPPIDMAIHANGVTLALARGDIRADLVIGADGIGSFARRFVPGCPSPKETGFVASRAIQNEMIAETELWLSPNFHLVRYGISRDTANVVLVHRKWEDPRVILQKCACECGAAESEWAGWPVADTRIDHNTRWSNGPIVLIGDAAHTMPPYAAQGAAMALEDAVTLAQACGVEIGEFDQRIGTWETRRLRRVSTVMKLARSNRHVYHLGRPWSFGRNIVMRNAPSRILDRRMSWVYGWRPHGERVGAGAR